MEKLALLERALRLRPNETAPLSGKLVLLVDDNITDGVTYWIARHLMLQAGASEVGLVALTRTLRIPEARHWIFP